MERRGRRAWKARTVLTSPRADGRLRTSCPSDLRYDVVLSFSHAKLHCATIILIVRHVFSPLRHSGVSPEQGL